MRLMNLLGRMIFLGLLPGVVGCWPLCPVDRVPAPKKVPRVPVLKEAPWQIAGDPDLGELTDPKQQPVDFGIWQAKDGMWQLWSCVRHTKCGGKTRLFYRWEGRRLTDPDWKPMGIAMQADAKYGETPGGLQAPFVCEDEGNSGSVTHRRYVMVHGDWVNIRLATSDDGKSFQRKQWPGRGVGLFSEGPEDNTRDPMMIRIGKTWYCYYTAHPGKIGADYCRTSTDLRTWSEAKIVARGGRTGSNAYSAECPFVVHLDGYFYLFRTQRYGKEAKTSVYRSTDPLDFGVDSDAFFVAELPVAAPEIIYHEGKWYLACLLPSLKGIQVYHLEWAAAAGATP